MTLHTSPASETLPIGHELVEGRTHHAVVVYGTAACHDTTRARAILENLDIEYNFYNIDADPAMAKTADALRGAGHGQKIPVIDLGEGQVLVEPTDDELEDGLRKSGRLPSQ